MLERLSSTPYYFSDAWECVWNRQLHSLSKSEYELQRYQKHLEPIIGHLHLGDITPLAIQDIVSHLIKKSYRPQTIKHIIGLIGRTFNLLIKWGLCNLPNPTAGVNLPKADNRRQRYLTSEEATTLLEALKVKSETTWGLTLLSLSTGMRLGEMLKLKGEHFNIHDKTIRIVDTKNNRNRTVFLPGAALEMLTNLNPKPGQFIFKNSTGSPFKTISDTYCRVVKKLGFNEGITDPRDKVVFHTLRHTFASWMTQDGNSIFLVSELLGHSSLEMTRRYSHMSPEKKRAATSTINSHLSDYTQKTESMQDNHVQLCINAEKKDFYTTFHEFTRDTYVILCNIMESIKSMSGYTNLHGYT